MRSFVCFGLLAFLVTCSCHARECRVARVFADHMILQREMAVPVWGWAPPDTEVTVSFAGQVKRGTAGRDRRWSVTLDPMPVSADGREMSISFVRDKETVARTLRDVLVGDVWLCSGQSNMASPLSRSLNYKTVADEKHPMVRVFNVKRPNYDQHVLFPQEDVPKGSVWYIGLSPGISAVGNYFAWKLQQSLRIPVGAIVCAYGGSPALGWVPKSWVAGEPALKDVYARLENEHSNYIAGIRAKLPGIRDWLDRIEAGERVEVFDLPRHPGLSHPGENIYYHSMLHPLVPYAVKGVIWYQGERDCYTGPEHYAEKFRTVTRCWRSLWNNENLPFYCVQIPPYGGYRAPEDLPALWREQYRAVRLIRNIGMVPTVDIADIQDIHPRRKLEVAERLAALVLNRAYGRKDVLCSGPTFLDAELQPGGAVRVRFSDIGDGLTCRDGVELSWFALADEQGNFKQASAEINGDAVIVSNPDIGKPTAVSLGWQDTAEPNLSNKDGWPAWPFVYYFDAEKSDLNALPPGP